MIFQLEGSVASLQADLNKTRQELHNQEAERARIACVRSFSDCHPCLELTKCSLLRKLEAELNEKLQDVHNKLLQAGVDQRESERDARLKETLSTLQRIFPGRCHWRPSR